MSSSLGFVASNVRPSHADVPLIDWTHQPWDRGAAAKPDVIDSAIVTAQFFPDMGDFTGNEAGLGYTELYAKAIWSAARQAKLKVEFDLVVGTAASFVATALKVNIVYDVLNPNQNPAFYALPTIPSVAVQATLGRGARAVSFLSDLIRSKYFGPLAGGVESPAIKIPPFSRGVYLTSRAPGGGAFTAIVRQRSGAPAGPVVQADTVVGTQPIQFVPITHVATYLTVEPGAPQDLTAVFRIVLP